MAVLYWEGIGVEQNIKKAILWAKKAARRNHPEAQNFIEMIKKYAKDNNKDLREFGL